MRRVTPLLLLALLCCAPSALASCPKVEIALTPQVQSGPTCLVAAALSAMSAHGPVSMSVQGLARTLPVYPEGIDWYDLAVALEAKGFGVRLSTGPPEAMARLVEAGFPVVALTRRGKGVHALSVHGVERTRVAGRCEGEVARILVMDPRHGKSRWVSREALAKAQSEARLLVIYRPSDATRLASKGFPLALAERVDRRLRAQALLKRALEHSPPNTQALTLLKRAASHDPCWAPLHEALTKTATHLGQPLPPRPTCPDDSHAGVSP